MEITKMQSGYQISFGKILSGQQKVTYLNYEEFQKLANYFYRLIVGDPNTNWPIIIDFAERLKKTVLYVELNEFMGWYFCSNANETCQSIGEQVRDDNIVTAQMLLDEVGYLPIDMILNKEDIRKEDIVKDYKEILNPGEKYNLQFKIL